MSNANPNNRTGQPRKRLRLEEVAMRLLLWNKIEHRMFSFISKNWRGKPLDSLATIVNLIANTTDTGLHIETSIDYAIYEKGIEVTDEELESLNIKREKFHGEWNYMIKPQV